MGRKGIAMVYMNDIVVVMEDMTKDMVQVIKDAGKQLFLFILATIFILVRIILSIVPSNLSQFLLGARIETDGKMRGFA